MKIYSATSRKSEVFGDKKGNGIDDPYLILGRYGLLYKFKSSNSEKRVLRQKVFSCKYELTLIYSNLATMSSKKLFP